MIVLLWLFLGLAVGLGFVAFTRKYGEEVERRLLALCLMGAALVYVLLAVAAYDSGWMAIELIGLLIFSALAQLGYKRSPLWLAAGWAAHPLWDALLHLSGVGANVAPSIYVFMCIGFDVAVAGYIVMKMIRRR